MENRIELSAPFIHAILQQHPKTQIPLTHELKLPLGMTSVLTIDLRLLRIEGNEIRIPVKATKLPDFELVVSQAEVRDGLVWLKPELRGMPLPIKLTAMVPKLVESRGLNPDHVRVDGERVGLDLLGLRPDLPVVPNTVTIADGIRLIFDLNVDGKLPG